MEELFRLVRDEDDIDKALSTICLGYILEPSYKSEYNCSLLLHAVYRKSLALIKTLVEQGAIKQYLSELPWITIQNRIGLDNP